MAKNPERIRLIKAKAEKRIKTRLDQGRGAGAGRDYQSFLHVRDVPSKGRSHRLPSATVGRIHHLLSDLELHVFMQLDWHKNVIDIREQFPLPMEASQKIAAEMSIAHPSYQGTGEVVTTDFLVDLMEYAGKITRRAISAKYVKDLDDPRVIEKFKLERRYWESKNIPFSIITEREIPELLRKNVQWFYPYINHFVLEDSEQHACFQVFLTALQRHPSMKLTLVMSQLDDIHNTDPGTHLSLMRHFMAQRAFFFDMEKLTVQNLRAMDVHSSESWLQEDYEYAIGE